MSCVEITQGHAPLAQLAEHLTLNQGVQGSNPCRRTKREKEYFSLFFCILPYPINGPHGLRAQ